MASMRPFLKWAGSKKWLAKQGIDVPSKGYHRYVEPFLGSGAVFFSLLPSRSLLSDANKHLINCYEQIQSDWETVFAVYEELFAEHSKERYYDVREKLSPNGALGAGQFLYLNRTCFNGIFRVNLNGKFNVPLGSKISNPFVRSDFQAWSNALSNAELASCDFESVISGADDGDLIFVDPPYTVAHNENGFIEYNEKIFSWDDQVRLANALMKARQRGADFILTNANHRSVRQLYEPYFDISKVDRRSVVAGNVEKRRPISEIIIRSFD
jgi:DNA adenine methylase